jgi:hypothetical protein
MLTVSFTLVLVFCIYQVCRRAARSPQEKENRLSVWRLAGSIAALRISALWFGVIGLHSTDWKQVAASLILMLDLPEIYLVKSARSEPLRWAILGSVILASTSIGWSALFYWVRSRLQLTRS